LRRRRLVLAYAVLAIAVALMTIYVSHHALPHGSTDLDEVAYQTQANTLRTGHASLARASVDPAFRPFLSGVHGSRVVFKYQPVWPALVAASDVAFGSSLPLRVLIAIALVLSVAWFAWELFRDERVALISAVLIAVSPFLWVQSATLLGYSLSFLLAVCANAALLRALRTRSVGVGVGAGAILGLGVLHRPFDVLVASALVAVYVAWHAARNGTLLRLAGAVVAGGAPFALTFFAYNRALMGSLTTMTYSATGQVDRFGFGKRASFVVNNGQPFQGINYTVGKAFATTGHVLALLPRFVGAAPVVAVGLGLAVWFGRRDARVWLLVGVVVSTIVAYFFWWGQANAEFFRIDRALGPFYEYALLAPLAVLAAWGLCRIASRRVLAALGAVAVVWLLLAPVFVLHHTVENGRTRARELSFLAAPPPALVFESPQFPDDPYVSFANPGNLRGPRVVALDLGARDLDVLDRFPSRRAYAARLVHDWNQPFDTLHLTRTPMEHVSSSSAFDVALTAPIPTGQTARPYVRLGDQPAVVQPEQRAGNIDTHWRVNVAGQPVGPIEIAVGVSLGPDAWYECRFAGRVLANGTVELLTPCEGWHHYAFPDGKTATANEDVTGQMAVQLNGA
jgi:hypothetical protein